MSQARKELAKALRVTFSNDQQGREAGSSSNSTVLDDYEPPASLLDELEQWATSSDIQGATTDRDTQRLKEVLFDDCFQHGLVSETAADGTNDRATQARSAFIVVLDRFSSLDSGVVTVQDIRDVWWSRLLLPSLTLPDTPSDNIRIGKTALKAARDLATRACDATGTSSTSTSYSGDKSEELQQEPESSKSKVKAMAWRHALFKAYLDAPVDSFAQRNLQTVLVAFGKTHPKDFFFTISELLDTPIEALGLLNTFIRTHPVQAYQVLQTPLFSKLISILNSLPVAQQDDDESRAEDVPYNLLVMSSALCSLNMLMPRLPTCLDKLLDRLYIILARCLLWYDNALRDASRPSGLAMTMSSVDDPDTSDEHAPAISHAVRPILTPLLDYFTQLYGLFPANTVAFLVSPTQWLSNYHRRMKKRRNRVASSANLSAMGRDALLHPLASEGLAATYSSSSTSADEDASGTDFQASGAEEGDLSGTGLRRKGSTSKAGGGRKGQRSKTNKAKRDVAAKAKKDKENAKQKERERRRRAVNPLQQGSGGLDKDSGTQNVPFPSSSEQDQSLDSIENSPGGTEKRTPKVRIEEPSSPPNQGTPRKSGTSVHSSADEGGTAGEYDEDGSDGSEASMQELDDVFEGLDLDGSLSRIDWSRVRELSVPYLGHHILSSGVLESCESEFANNKLRFKKLEVPDLVDEITRTRSPALHTTPQGGDASAPLEQLASPSVGSPLSPFQSSSLGLSIDSLGNDRQLLMYQSQLTFEIYQKNQLVQRLGSLLRDRIATSGAEADKQNLMHQIRALKTQLLHSQTKLEQLRHESALSRERLNKYSNDQSNRVEKLRAEKQALNSENTSLKSELTDLKASLAAINEKLAYSESARFDLEAEKQHEAERQKKQTEVEAAQEH